MITLQIIKIDNIRFDVTFCLNFPIERKRKDYQLFSDNIEYLYLIIETDFFVKCNESKF